MTKLFDLQYFDIHDTNLNELYQFVNCDLPDERKINNINDLALYLLPNVSSRRQSINAVKLNSLFYFLNLIVHDLRMINELTDLHGKYEAFNCYRRIIIKSAIDICRLTNSTNYMMNEQFIRNTSNNAQLAHEGIAQSDIVDILMKQLDFSDERNVKFAELFF